MYDVPLNPVPIVKVAKLEPNDIPLIVEFCNIAFVTPPADIERVLSAERSPPPVSAPDVLIALALVTIVPVNKIVLPSARVKVLFAESVVGWIVTAKLPVPPALPDIITPSCVAAALVVKLPPVNVNPVKVGVAPECISCGNDNVHVLFDANDCPPADETTWFVVPLIVIVLPVSTIVPLTNVVLPFARVKVLSAVRVSGVILTLKFDVPPALPTNLTPSCVAAALTT